MDRKTILALLLILVVFWISSEFIWKRTASQPAPKQILEEKETASQTEQKPLQTSEIETSIKIIDNDIDVNSNIILQNDLLKLRFSNLGAVLLSAELAEFVLADKITPVNLIQYDQNILGTKLQMSSGNIVNLNNIPFNYQQSLDEIVFAAETQYGKVQKIFRISQNYEVELTIRLEADNEIGGYQIIFDSGIADTEEYLKMKSRDYKIVGQVDNTISKFTLSKLKENRVVRGLVDWAAIKSKYFTIAIMPDDLIDINKLEAFQSNDSPALNLNIDTDRQTISHHYKMYLGPLVYENLNRYGNGIENIVEMGPKFLQWISKIFQLFLTFLYSFIPSWGICIIIFAVVLKVLLYPLTHKAFESTTKMQRVNPIIKEIQQKYKKDPQTMNAELRKVYKEHGVNPLGGCLPMLLQMPIIFALYPILRYSIDFRQASFLWLPDLSEPDPVWALPILMAVFMFVQQKLMAPSQQKLEEMDDKQKAAMQSQKMMMYFMPIMMFFIFKGLSSGLVLYWTVFSIIGSIQQYFIKKKFD